jgi:cholesterol transport system auxiliary component
MVLAFTAWLAGCAAMGERQAHRYYLLEPRPAAATPQSGAIMAAPTTAASFYDTQDIVFSRTPGTRGYYQFSHWTERPQRVLQGELAARYAPARDGYILATHLVEMYHDAAAVPGTTRVTVTAELIERAHRTPVARRTFTGEAPAASHDAAGAVAGFNAATALVLDDIVAWADREAATRSARKLAPERGRNCDLSFTTRSAGAPTLAP